jgi:hypothetical protein
MLNMRWWRHSTLNRVVALAILLWTAADLSNVRLCALDNEGHAPVSVAPVSTGVESRDGAMPKAPQPAAPHIDDCFCCSHCVDVTAALPQAPSTLVRTQAPWLVVIAPRGSGSPFYHPPQGSLQ